MALLVKNPFCGDQLSAWAKAVSDTPSLTRAQVNRAHLLKHRVLSHPACAAIDVRNAYLNDPRQPTLGRDMGGHPRAATRAATLARSRALGHTRLRIRRSRSFAYAG